MHSQSNLCLAWVSLDIKYVRKYGLFCRFNPHTDGGLLIDVIDSRLPDSFFYLTNSTIFKLWVFLGFARKVKNVSDKQ